MQQENTGPLRISDLLKIAVISLAVSGIIYYCYYLLAPWIWSQNIPYNPEDITPWILAIAKEHDGVEIYALYLLVFANMAVALATAHLIDRITIRPARYAIIALCAAVSCIYCQTIGFIPPMNSFQQTSLPLVIRQSLTIMAVCFPLITLLSWLQQHYPRWGVALGALSLAPCCFIATSAISWFDYSYIFAPALRLIHHAALSDIYFQYDLLPSLLAAGWMKLGLDLNRFQVLGQAAYYLVILALFVFSGKLFKQKGLAVFLLMALVLGRIYATPADIVNAFQVTPLRLDLWFPLLLVVYRNGPYHWSAGLVCGLLILFLRNFGIIYSIAYLQLLLTLYLLDQIDGRDRESVIHGLLEYGKRCAVPVAVIICCTILSQFLFHNDEFGNYAGYYRKIGIGFIRIAKNSFYWYIPALVSVVIILLFQLRRRVSPTYLATGFLVTFCAIGNSVYFFGRSHEHNIINISIILLFLFFLMLDLIAHAIRVDTEDGRVHFLSRHSVTATACLMTAAIIVSYSKHIYGKSARQIENAGRGQLIYPLEKDASFFALKHNLNSIRTATGNSSKVYFVDRSDFELYLVGGYAPVGYCNPYMTWIFVRDLIGFLQKLLDNSYYLVFSQEQQHLLLSLRHNDLKMVEGTVVATNLPIKATDHDAPE